jgi:hypothetical protein
MIVMKTQVDLDGISGDDIQHFMLYCTDDEYKNWWSGTHLGFHTIRRYPHDLGNSVSFDEYIGERRLRFEGMETEIIPGKKITWQMRKAIKLPGWLELSFEDGTKKVRIIHTLRVGFTGAGRILDPMFRLFFTKEFENALEVHAQTEFHKLADMLA